MAATTQDARSVPPVQEARRISRRRSTRRDLNVPLIKRILLLALIVAGASYVLHEYQLQRNASAFLRQADRAADQGHLGQSALYLSRYLTYEPDDLDVLARYGLTLEK